MTRTRKILFITYDVSGYYDCIYKELKNRFEEVDYYNTAVIKFKYKNSIQRIYSFFFKLFKGQKLKNYLKFQPLIEATNKEYDYILMIRPDVFFDSQLKILRKRTNNFIAYYHDSISNIKRKKDVIHFFDVVYSYEKKDVEMYGLEFITNFIYLDTPPKESSVLYKAFTIMAIDYRMEVLKKLAKYFKMKGMSYKFLVHSDKKKYIDLIEIINRRKNNKEVLEYIQKAEVIVDIHKFGVQDGLTFRVFESLFFEKKLITTNQDILTYDFYNSNNIWVIKNRSNIEIPSQFFETPYEKVDPNIYWKYYYKNWLNQILDRN